MQSNRKTVDRSYVIDQDIDLGLRSYMLKVYNYMFMGLGITGVVAYFATTSIALMTFLYSGLGFALTVVGLIAMVYALSARIYTMSKPMAQLSFWAYSGMMGLSVSRWFYAYTGASIVRVFLITATTFGAMSFYGYITKKDLSGLGSFLFMGLIGLIIASVVNIFTQSSVADLMISYVGVLIFAGLTAYDTQQIKEIYYSVDSDDISEKKSILGALKLYLDFINLFIFLLRIMGDRR